MLTKGNAEGRVERNIYVTRAGRFCVRVYEKGTTVSLGTYTHLKKAQEILAEFRKKFPAYQPGRWKTDEQIATDARKRIRKLKK